MGEPFSTMVWVNRVEGLKSHLRIIATECGDSDNPHVQRIGRQALAGVAEADRYLADQDWGSDPDYAAATPSQNTETGG